MIEAEEVIYVNDGLQISRDHDVYFCENEEYEYRMVEPSMANPKKDLAKMIDASENLPQHYKEYLALGENICKFIPFKDYLSCPHASARRRGYDLHGVNHAAKSPRTYTDIKFANRMLPGMHYGKTCTNAIA